MTNEQTAKRIEQLRKCKGCGELFPSSEFQNKEKHKGRFNIYCTRCGGRTYAEPVSMVKCNLCGISKPVMAFKEKPGPGRIPETCLECKETDKYKDALLKRDREYNKKYRVKNRKKVNKIAKISAGKRRLEMSGEQKLTCIVCGVDKPVMAFKEKPGPGRPSKTCLKCSKK